MLDITTDSCMVQTMNEPLEEWRQIPDFPMYSASNLGRVRREFGSKDPAWNGRLLKPKKHWAGYSVLTLYVLGKPKYVRIHCIIAATFIGPRPPGHDVCHNNGDRKDNRASNLRYATRKENEADKFAHGTDRYSRPLSAKITREDVIEIRRLRKETGMLHKDIAARYGLQRVAVTDILSRKNWSHVP